MLIFDTRALASIEPSRARARAEADSDPDWTYRELKVPHDVEVTQPQPVIDLLRDLG